MTALIDTNVLVYRHDPHAANKQRIATDVLRRGRAADALRLPHQAIIEFMAAVRRPRGVGEPLLSIEDARRETEELLVTFPVLYPNKDVVRTAIWGAATYALSWYDAHLWAYAEHYGLDELWSEDFQHGRLYGSVRVTNPFATR